MDDETRRLLEACRLLPWDQRIAALRVKRAEADVRLKRAISKARHACRNNPRAILVLEAMIEQFAERKRRLLDALTRAEAAGDPPTKH